MTSYKRQKNEISNSAAFITEVHLTMRSSLTDTIPHGRTIMYMVSPATEVSIMAVGHFSKIVDLGKNGLQLIGDAVTRLKNEFATNDPNVVFLYIPFLDEEMERSVEMCSLEMLLLQNVIANDKMNIIADTRNTRR